MKFDNNYFHQALSKNFTDKEHPQFNVWMDYALSTNDRGKDIVSKIKEFSNSITGKRHLDIGCGYGGTSIAFAEVGAISTGIDFNNDLLCLAEENLKDHPGVQVEFKNLDIMNYELISKLGVFDIITCDNVIEHVEVPEKLIAHIHLLLSEKGIAYLTIPNAFSLGQIIKDCHYGQFGVSLLDPIDGAILVDQKINQLSYEVSNYYPFSYYDDQISKYGLAAKLLNTNYDLDSKMNEILLKIGNIKNLLEELKNDEKISSVITQKIKRNINNYLARLETDILIYRKTNDKVKKSKFGSLIVRDYETELWYLLIKKNKNNFGNNIKKSIRRLFYFT